MAAHLGGAGLKARGSRRGAVARGGRAGKRRGFSLQLVQDAAKGQLGEMKWIRRAEWIWKGVVSGSDRATGWYGVSVEF